MLYGRCWTSCNLFPIRNLAVSQHAPSIVKFFIFFQSFPTFCYFVYHLLLRPGTGRFFRNRRYDFQQSNVAMLDSVFFLHSFKFACLLEINIHSLSSGSHIAVSPLRSRRAQSKANSNSNNIVFFTKGQSQKGGGHGTMAPPLNTLLWTGFRQ